MKKIFTFITVLLVATAVFASVGLTVKAGGAFGFNSYKSVADCKVEQKGWTFKYETYVVDKALILKSNGFGFDVGVQYDIADKIMIYADFNMLFPKNAKTNVPDDRFDVIAKDYFDKDVIEKYFDDGLFKVFSLEELSADIKDAIGSAVSTEYSFFSVSAGFAYKFDFNAVKLAVGGGVTINKATAKYLYNQFKVELPSYTNIDGYVSFTAFGLNAMVEAKYMVAKSVGVGVTLIPQVGLYNKAVFHVNDEGRLKDFTSQGFKASFAMPIVVGVSYTF
jgi:hypothetical protein